MWVIGLQSDPVAIFRPINLKKCIVIYSKEQIQVEVYIYIYIYIYHYVSANVNNCSDLEKLFGMIKSDSSCHGQVGFSPLKAMIKYASLDFKIVMNNVDDK